MCIMTYQFEFDSVNKILLLRFEGRLSEELAKELYWAIRGHSIETDASAGIYDCSCATEIDLSPEFVCQLTKMDPAMPDATRRPRFVVVPPTFGRSISRIVEIETERRNPLLKVVYSIDEAFTALGVQPPHFEPLG